jgi:hypothetical protein
MRMFDVTFIIFQRNNFTVVWSIEPPPGGTCDTFYTQGVEEVTFSSFQAILATLKRLGLPEGFAFNEGPYLVTEQQLKGFGFKQMPPCRACFGAAVIH